MRGNVHEACSFGHDRPGAVHEVRQRQKLGDLLNDGVRSFEGDQADGADPDAGAGLDQIADFDDQRHGSKVP